MLTDLQTSARSPNSAERPRHPARMVAVSLEDPPSRAFMRFVRTGSAAAKYADNRFYLAHRLSMAKYLVLLALAINGDKATHYTLADWTNTKRHNITTLIDRMERARFVTTRRSLLDRRSVEVILTEQGRRALALAMPVARGIVQELMRGMTQEDVVSLEAHLKTIEANVEQRHLPVGARRS